MAKKFMYVCFGIMALMVAFHLGAQYGQAGYVDQSTTGIVASEDIAHFLLDDGTVRTFSTSTGWSRHSTYDLPVSASQVKFWGWSFFISTANEIWVTDGLGGWSNYGSPDGAASTQPTTWGQIKAELGE